MMGREQQLEVTQLAEWCGRPGHEDDRSRGQRMSSSWSRSNRPPSMGATSTLPRMDVTVASEEGAFIERGGLVTVADSVW